MRRARRWPGPTASLLVARRAAMSPSFLDRSCPAGSAASGGCRPGRERSDLRLCVATSPWQLHGAGRFAATETSFDSLQLASSLQITVKVGRSVIPLVAGVDELWPGHDLRRATLERDGLATDPTGAQDVTGAARLPNSLQALASEGVRIEVGRSNSAGLPPLKCWGRLTSRCPCWSMQPNRTSPWLSLSSTPATQSTMASSFVGGLSLGPTHVPGPQAGLTMTDLLGTPLASSLAAQQAQALPARPPMAGAALSNPFAGWLGLNAISGGQLLPGASILGLAAPPGPSTYPSLANPLQLGTKTPGDELASERLAVQPAFTPRGDGVEARAQAGSSEVLTRAAEVGKPPSGPSSVRSFAATSHATTGRMPQQGVQGTPKSPHPSSKSKYGFRFQPKELVFLEHIFHERYTLCCISP
eukprot:scaffold1911_cov397-Prasinococcus_capsulatus_cf.AAC.12